MGVLVWTQILHVTKVPYMSPNVIINAWGDGVLCYVPRHNGIKMNTSSIAKVSR